MKPGDIVTWDNVSSERVQTLEGYYGPGPYVISGPGAIYRKGERTWRLYRMCDGEIFSTTSFNEEMLKVCVFLNAAKEAIDET